MWRFRLCKLPSEEEERGSRRRRGRRGLVTAEGKTFTDERESMAGLILGVKLIKFENK